LIQPVTCQVLAGRPSQVACQPLSLTSTDFKLRIPCYHLLESVSVKQTREKMQSAAGQPESLDGRPPLGFTGQWPLHTALSCEVHSRGDTYFGGILIFLVIC
jgi:hypothetical protein